MTLHRRSTLLLGSLNVTLTILLSWIYLFLDASYYSAMASGSLENSDHVVVSVSNDFWSNSKWDALLHPTSHDCS